MKKTVSHSILSLIVGLTISYVFLGCSAKANAGVKQPITWVGTWATAPQLVEPHNEPPAPGLTNNTLRQIVRVSIGGEMLRLRFSNDFSEQPVTMKAVSIAVSLEGSRIDEASSRFLTFNGRNKIILQPHSEVYSDSIAFHLAPGSRVAITISFGETSQTVTGHPGSRTTSYLADTVKTDHWYVIQGIDVKASPGAAAIAVLGNSITDGRGSGTNQQNRWTDILSQRLLQNPETSPIGVLNLGIGGNCVLRGGLGPTALERFERDILSQSGVRWLVLLEGINDMGSLQNEERALQVTDGLIDAYTGMIEKAHERGIKVYGCTILPFAKSFYDTPFSQQARDRINEWIRNSGRFDAVIDFDKVMRESETSQTILPDMHDNDFLHPNEAGYKRMGESVDLELFKR